MMKFNSYKYLVFSGIFLIICVFLFMQTKGRRLNRGGPDVIASSGTYQAGDTLYGILDTEDINPDEARDLVKAMNPFLKAHNVMIGDKYEISKSTYGTLFSFNYWITPVEYYSVCKSTDNIFECNTIAIPYKEVITTTTGYIKSSLYEGMAGRNVSPELIMSFADIFSWQVDFLVDTRQDDSFKIVYKQYRYDNDKVKDGEILAAEYSGKVTSKHTAVYFESRDKKYSHFYTPEGNSLRKMFLKAPLSFRRISSYFTNRRFHPILRYYRPHHGIDYSAPSGTPVSSIGDGVVTFVGWKGGTGKTILIKHNATYTTAYGHLSRYAKGLVKGKRIRQGEIIGFVGSTGLSTGPHLHFGITRNGTYINYFSLKFPPASSIPNKYKLEFESMKNKVLPLLSTGWKIG